MELVTGASGYVGDRLLRRLAAEGRPLRALARNPERMGPLPGVEAVRGDLLTGHGLDAALDGVRSAYYLVHSMEAGTNGDFAGRDRRAAEAFAGAAARAGVEQIVYLGGSRRPAGSPPTSARASRSRRSCSRACLGPPRCAPRS